MRTVTKIVSAGSAFLVAGAGKAPFKVGQGLGTIRATVKATRG
jgi:hypothetical protein